LTNLDELFKSDTYLGTYTTETEDGKNIAGMSLFLEPKDHSYGIKKLVVDAKNFAKQSHHILNLGLLSLIPAALFYTMNSKFQVKPSISAIIAIGLNVGLMFGYTKMIKFGRMYSVYEKRGKYVGFCYQGEEKYQKELIDLLFTNMHKVAHSKGLISSSLDVDTKDKYIKCYPRGMRFSSIILNKMFGNDKKGPSNYHNLLFDPRDQL